MTDLAVTVAVTDSAGLKATASSTITVTGPQTTINVGETAIAPTGDAGNGNLLVAQKITLTQQATLVSLSFYVKTAGGQLRLGLYSGATAPTTLLAQTNAFTPVIGWNTQVPTSLPVCPAGTYWLAYFPQSNSLAFVNAQNGLSFWKSLTFGAMPASFPASPSSGAVHWSEYGTFSIGPPPPQLPPGTPIGIGLSSVSVGKPPNANSVVGAVNVTTSGGAAYTGQLTLGGTDAAKFALTHGGVLPCNLVVGPTDIPAGSYSINLTAS